MLYEKKADEEGHLFFSVYEKGCLRPCPELPHFHNSIEIFFVAKGEYRVHIGGEGRILCEGECAFVDKLIPHRSGESEMGGAPKVYVVVASATYLDGVKWLKGEALPPFIPKCGLEQRLMPLIEWAYAERDKMNEEMKRGFVTLLLGLLKSYAGTEPRRSESGKKFLTEVMIYINEHFTDDITLEFLSKNFGYEKTYLSRCFNKLFGMNLREYLNRVRISYAEKKRRREPSTPIYKIAEECGFQSLNTFYRALKKYAPQRKEKHNF